MVRDRLSPYLESKGFFADTMFGFRPHMSAQDVLLQLHRAVIQPTTMQHNDKAILALDLKGAFDNVKHDSILANLSSTDCGARTFAYIRDFLSKRQALLRIEDEEYGPYIMGTRGTPQGAVLSPLLFNIAMMRLPNKLAQVEGIQHAVYADDITIWTTEGSIGEMQERLQRAASIVEAYANDCGLQCAPTKSELLHVRAKPTDKSAIHISLSGVPIREVEELRILGLFIHHRLRPDSTIAKLRIVGEQVGRMIHRVSNKRGGLRGRDALRLAHAFVTSRILYAVPYLRTNKHEDDRIDAIIRKATKRALDLPVATSNAKLRALGVLNSYQELREAHLVNQYTRLVQTAPGRRLLNRLQIQHEADVAPGPLVVTAQRVSVADPTVPYTYEEMVILGGRPKHFSSNLFSIALTFSPMFTRVESFQKVYRRLVEQGGALPAAQLFSLSTLQDIQAERAAMLFTRVAINRRLHRYCPMLHGEFYYARQPVTQVPMTTFVRKGLPRAVRRTLDAK
ncbi:uncharacterized protein LOC125757367 [Rhipicephalus sanguineus]|uniref:uncharacterized protein LOC125757367 n=1 Tax=Rhipicephalus sanguineus TaxID=34632 RepID=UPI0020C4333C|nr:uncharacterized protein LOC125757367 [Rhipicephalus sanguineus]